MAAALPKPHFEAASPPPQTISPQESARYTSELLGSLQKIAFRQDQHLLAHLLELAMFEARCLARGGKP
jgi:hypothetical protein